MCGICGIINLNKEQPSPSESSLKNMRAKIKHRGPNDEGLFIDKNVGFGFVRLSILDLSMDGHQPMTDLSGNYTIAFNGEIYNYLELRKELTKKGYKFASKTDTEVLLYSFIEWGQSCLNKLNGMFAFAIHNKKSNKVFIARDRFGIKPLYYYKDEDQFLFSSEIPSILTALEKSQIKPNYQSIFDYLVFNRTDQTSNTFFEGIKKLQHGHFITINKGLVEDQNWYTLRDNLSTPFSSPEEYREMLSSSIGLRLRSDVPVGVCLSGGLDSSSIVSVLLKDYEKDDLNTFSAVYGKNVKGDESKFINIFNRDLDNMYYTYPNADSLFEDVFEFVRAHGEPVPSTSPYAQYKVMELAKEHVVVTLDGQGADEQLGGYHYFFGNYFKELLLQRKFLKLFNESFYYSKNHKSLFAFKTLAFFMLPESLKTATRIREKNYLDEGFSDSFASDNEISGLLYESNNLREALLNHFEYKLEHLLKWEDRNSMFFSLESRVPFLDNRLVEKTLSLPSNEIINKGYTKAILREAMKNVLPDEIRLRQDKIGFGTPEDEWFRSDKFKNFITELIGSSSFQNRGIFDPKKIELQYKKHLKREINISKEIWKWINLELWFREFVD